MIIGLSLLLLSSFSNDAFTENTTIFENRIDYQVPSTSDVNTHDSIQQEIFILLDELAIKLNREDLSDSLLRIAGLEAQAILGRNTSRDFEPIFRYLDKKYTSSLLLYAAGTGAIRHDSKYAEKKLQKALQAGIEERRNLLVALCYYQLGYLAGEKGKYQKAIDYFLQANKIFKEENLLHRVALSYSQLAYMSITDFKIDAALNYLSQAEKILPYIEDHEFFHEVLNQFLTQKFSIYMLMGNYKKAAAINDSLLIMNPHYGNRYNRALLNLSQGYYREAASLMTAVIDEFEDLGYNAYLGGAHLINADIYLSMSVYDTAMIHSRLAIEYMQKYDAKNRLCRAYERLSEIQFDFQFKEEAVSSGQKAIDCFSSTSNGEKNRQLYNAQFWMSQFYEKLDQLDRAHSHLDTCFQLARELSLREVIPALHIRQGKLLFDSKQLKKAEFEFETALQIAKEVQQLNAESSSLFHLAKVELEQGNFDQAEEKISTCIELAEKIEYVKLLEEVYPTAIEIYKKQQKFAKALQFQEELSTLKDTIRSFAVNDLSARYAKEFNLQEKEQENEELKKLNLEQQRQNSKSKKIYLIAGFILLGLLSVLSMLYIKREKRKIQYEFQQDLSRDMHDDIGGILVNLSKTANLAVLEGGQSEKNRERFNHIIDLSKSVLLSFRNILNKTDVNPITIERFGEILDQFTELNFKPFTNEYKLTYKKTGFDENQMINNETSYHSFMIYKGIVQNIFKHGKEGEVTISLYIQNDILNIFAENKTGAEDPIAKIGGKGIKILQERADLLNAKIKFSSQEGKYITEAEIPLK